jgi:hypothetical protein
MSTIVKASLPAEQFALAETFGAVPDAEFDAVRLASDGPSLGFVRSLGTRLVRERASLRTAARVCRSTLSVVGTGVACRLAASLTRHTPWRVEVDSPTSHEASVHDSPAEQAADERRQVRTATAVMESLEPSPSSRCRAQARERHMADRLDDLRAQGDIVAVLGAAHVDPVVEQLRELD